jgi:hypothetical protein
VYNHNLKIYRSTDNQLEFQVKNGDQKATNIVGTTVVFNLFNHETQSLLLSRDCQTLSNVSGNVRVILTEQDLLDLEPGLYSYSLVQELREEDIDSYTVISKKPLYIDEQFGAVATIEVSGDVQGGLRSSTTVKEFKYTNPAALGESQTPYFTSSIIDARPHTTNPQSLHTFQFYFEDFDGTVTIQGSMGEGGNPSTWVDIPNSAITPGVNDFIPSTSVIYKNVVGKWNWFRIKQTGHKGVLASFVITRDTVLLDEYDVSLQNAGSGYSSGDVLIINGKRLGGADIENDLIITVTGVAINGAIETFTFTGVPDVDPNFKTYVLEPVQTAQGSIDKIVYR